jgi:alkylhydroperoxidase family enzyme
MTSTEGNPAGADRAFIQIVPDDQWSDTPGLDAQFESLVDSEYGRIDNIMAIHSLNPAGLAAHNALYMSAMTGTATLRKVERELIAYVVSLENHCHY